MFSLQGSHSFAMFAAHALRDVGDPYLASEYVLSMCRYIHREGRLRRRVVIRHLYLLESACSRESTVCTLAKIV